MEYCYGSDFNLGIVVRVLGYIWDKTCNNCTLFVVNLIAIAFGTLVWVIKRALLGQYRRVLLIEKHRGLQDSTPKAWARGGKVEDLHTRRLGRDLYS